MKTVGTFLRAIAQNEEAGSVFNSGCTHEEVEAFEKSIGVPVPDELLRFYRAHDGSEDYSVLGLTWSPVEQVLSRKRTWDELFAEFAALDIDEDFDEREQRFRWGFWNPTWIPLLTDDSKEWAIVTTPCFEPVHAATFREDLRSEPRTAEEKLAVNQIREILGKETPVSAGAVVSFDSKSGEEWKVEFPDLNAFFEFLAQVVSRDLLDGELYSDDVESLRGDYEGPEFPNSPDEPYWDEHGKPFQWD